MDRQLFPDAPDSLIEELSLTCGIPSSVSTFLLHTDGKWVLFDAGLGAERGGQTVRHLLEMGLTPDSIEAVMLTHCHGDHIGGLATEGKATFPNARIYISQAEYDAWKNEGQEWMNIYADRTHTFQWGDMLPHEITTQRALGHTPGHTVFRKSNLLVVGDLMHGTALQMSHPEISCRYDQNKEQAASTRKAIYDKAQMTQLIMAGMHFPEPGFILPEQYEADETGFIVRIGDMAPDFTATLDDGTKVRLSDLRGKVVMLQFTASWCGVCRKEMPFIERDIWLPNKDRGDFCLLAIDRDEPLETVQHVREKTGITYPMALDPGAEIYVRYALRQSGITRNVLINREGRIVHMTRLYDEEMFAELLRKIQNELAQ